MTTIPEIKSSLRRTIELAQAATAGEWHAVNTRLKPSGSESFVNANGVRIVVPRTDVKNGCFIPMKQQFGTASFIANARSVDESMARALLAAIEDFEILANDGAVAGIRGLHRIREAWQ